MKPEKVTLESCTRLVTQQVTCLLSRGQIRPVLFGYKDPD